MTVSREYSLLEELINTSVQPYPSTDTHIPSGTYLDPRLYLDILLGMYDMILSMVPTCCNARNWLKSRGIPKHLAGDGSYQYLYIS